MLKKPIRTVVATGLEFKDVPQDHWAASVLASVKGAEGLLPTQDVKVPAGRASHARRVAGHGRSLRGDRQLKGELGAPVDTKQVEVAYRMLHYTDFEAIKGAYRPYVRFVFGDEQRKAWLIDVSRSP